ncbi:MAG TPA: GNAT family N-acetyltransferase [Ktedonobacterales bacterium]
MVQICKARRDDAQGIAQVHVASWRSTYHGIMPAEFLAGLSVERRAQYWLETLAAGVELIYVAEDIALGGPRILGFASGGAQRDTEIPSYDGELYAVYMLQEYQGQGVGQRLARTVAERLAQIGFKAMLVWVLADNPSRRFYERLGGQFVREKQIDIAGISLSEVAYGWPDIHTLLEMQ